MGYSPAKLQKKINQAKIQIFEKINRIGKTLASLNKEKKREVSNQQQQQQKKLQLTPQK